VGVSNGILNVEDVFRRRRWVAVIDHGARKLNGNVMGVGMMLLMAMEGDEERLG
jgi:hypothetical protein